ncbi:MAG: hypothetical protein M3P93_00185 [Actinomycetota bacterium]|nr:hypothetical protein [Actinomycetota bacterium]
MGIKDLFTRGSSGSDDAGDGTEDSAGSSPTAQQPPRGDEPGASTTPTDDGRGTIGLGDRIGGAAPDTNQGKTEPMPPTPGHADPAGTGPHTNPPQVPELGDMNVGAATAQIASPTQLASAGDPSRTGGAQGGVEPVPTSAGSPSGAVQAGTVPADDRPHPGTSSSTGLGSGPEMPEQASTGVAHRAPGLQGETPEGESVESDTAVGAARMAPGAAPDRTRPPVAYPGDSQGVNVPHEIDAAGTSEEQGIVHGVKDPAGAPPDARTRPASE